MTEPAGERFHAGCSLLQGVRGVVWVGASTIGAASDQSLKGNRQADGLSLPYGFEDAGDLKQQGLQLVAVAVGHHHETRQPLSGGAVGSLGCDGRRKNP